MFNKKILALILVIGVFFSSTSFAASLEENWNDFLHYTKIGRLDMATGYGQAILQSNPDPVELLRLSEENPRGYDLLLRARETADDEQLAQTAGDILSLIEEGRYQRRTDPEILVQEVERLQTTDRGRLAAIKLLKQAGEYSVPYILEGMKNTQNKEDFANLVWALPRIGRDAIRPLAASLEMDNLSIKSEVIKALGEIGYPQGLAYLKYVVENSESQELVSLARESIRKIDPAGLNVSAAQLFYQLAENYYYHADSLSPAQEAEFANVWFWNQQTQRLRREQVDRDYFYELYAMRSTEWSLRADPEYGQAIGLWIASFFKAQQSGVSMPEYFGSNHADALVYAATAGPEYINQALGRAVKDKNAYVSLGCVEALGRVAGRQSLMLSVGPRQPVTRALSFDNQAVRYSTAIAIANAGPTNQFPQSELVVENIAEAISQAPSDINVPEHMNGQLAGNYAYRGLESLLSLARSYNEVIDISAAQQTLIEATSGRADEIKNLAGEVLAYIESPDAQRAIADMGLDSGNSMDVRIGAFESLARSAKLHASLLDDQRINDIYSLVGSQQVDPGLRSAAASAFGSLNLPSEKVKDLILDQAKM